LSGREQNTVEINTDGGERDPLAADFLVAEFPPARGQMLQKRTKPVKQIQT
jgi:hypothetical protein